MQSQRDHVFFAILIVALQNEANFLSAAHF